MSYPNRTVALAVIALAGACSSGRAPGVGGGGDDRAVACRNDCSIEVANGIGREVEVFYYAGSSGPRRLGSVSSYGRQTFPVIEDALPTNVQVRIGGAQGRMVSCVRQLARAERVLRLTCQGMA